MYNIETFRKFSILLYIFNVISMNNLKDILLEKLKITKNSSVSNYDHIDVLEPGSIEKAEEILSAIKERYGWLFDEENMRIMRTNNIELGRFKDEYNHGMYGNQMFTFYLNTPIYIIRRQNFPNGKAYGPPSKFIEGFSTLEETFNKFDDKLRKRGYLK